MIDVAWYGVFAGASAEETLDWLLEDCGDGFGCVAHTQDYILLQQEVKSAVEWACKENLLVGPWTDPAKFGNDFVLTREGHGTGFWDRYSGGIFEAVGLRLTEIAHSYGEVQVSGGC